MKTRYKLDHEQMKEVNKLIEEAQNNLEEILFKLIWERDNYKSQLYGNGRLDIN